MGVGRPQVVGIIVVDSLFWVGNWTPFLVGFSEALDKVGNFESEAISSA